ncbi:hypothetical protein Tco_0684201 [Tanacetum coccineum]
MPAGVNFSGGGATVAGGGEGLAGEDEVERERVVCVSIKMEMRLNGSPKPVLLSLKHAQLPVLGSTRMYRDLRLPTSGPK